MLCKIQLEERNHVIFCKEDGAVRANNRETDVLFRDQEDVPKSHEGIQNDEEDLKKF